MKKCLLLSILTVIGITVWSQTTLYYNFNNSLNEINGAGPALTVLGTQGNYVIDTLNEIAGSNKTVYRFEKNNGVQFNNVAAGNFLGETYTIEIYFVFDELSSWKRVVDWKNRKTDYGAYVYYGQLNFYPYLYSTEAPVAAHEYTYYVITRDGSSKNVLIYTDAEVKINFTDNNNDAVVDQDGVVNFFYDDLAVPGEAASGAVALLKLYNYALDSTTIRHKWEQLGSSVFGVNEVLKSNLNVNVYPNPVTDILNIDLSVLSKQNEASVRVVNEIGQVVYAEKILVNADSYDLSVKNYKKGIYSLLIETDREIARAKFVVL